MILNLNEPQMDGTVIIYPDNGAFDGIPTPPGDIKEHVSVCGRADNLVSIGGTVDQAGDECCS